MFFFRNRVNKKDKKEAEKCFLDFLEGRISTKDFWKQYSVNRILQKVLKFDKARWKKTYMLGSVKMRHYGKGPYDKIFNYNPDTLLDVVDINKLYDVYCLYCVINKYFIYRGFNPKCGNKEMQQYLFLQKLVPSYVNVYDIKSD